MLLRISGRGILTALNQMLESHPIPSGSYPHLSQEFRLQFDSTTPSAKSKVISLTHRGQPIDLDRIYKLSCTTFMATGGDGITGFPTYGTIISKDSWKVGDLVLAYLRKHQLYQPHIIPRVFCSEQ